MSEISLEKYQLDSFSVSYSSLNSPYENLAIENDLIQGNFEGESHLFFYRNAPCLVLGRFQVPWREVNMPHFLSRNKSISLVRRRSGGGTVYHDLGNWNFCFIHKQRDLPRKQNLALMIDLLATVGIEVSANERYDLVYKESKDRIFKVSGSAFKQKKETCLHHGTLLMDASLKSLKGCLGLPNGWELEGKGVHSTPSPVLNLGEAFGVLEFSEWISKVEKFFGVVAKKWSLDDFSDEMIQEMNELSSWEWIWGETPKFEVKLPLARGVLCLEFFKGQCVSALICHGQLEFILSSLTGAYLGRELMIDLMIQVEKELDLNKYSLDTTVREALSYFFF